MKQIVGYKLINLATGATVAEWGGTPGQCPGIPNPIILPNGDRVHAAAVNKRYGGHMLKAWRMDAPTAAPMPHSVDAAQIRLQLLKTGLLDEFEKAVSSDGRAAQVEWEFRTVYNRGNTLLNKTAAAIGLSIADTDKLFIAASKL